MNIWKQLSAGLGLLGLFLLALGLPVTSTVQACLLWVVACGLLLLKPAFTFRSLAPSVCLLSLGALARLALPNYSLQEGHQIFLTEGSTFEPLGQLLSPDVFHEMKQQFMSRYPPIAWVLRNNSKGWRYDGSDKYRFFPDYDQYAIERRGPPRVAWAFSSDSMLQNSKYSRIANEIDFATIEDLRIGSVNDLSYDDTTLDMNWLDQVTPVGDVKKANLPFYVFYDIPAELVGQQLCWQGSLLITSAGGGFDKHDAPDRDCLVIGQELFGQRIYGLSIDSKLSMHLAPVGLLPWTVERIHRVLPTICAFLAALSIFAIPVFDKATSLRRYLVAAAAVSLGLVTLANSKLFAQFSGYYILPSGEDGITHEAFVRCMASAYKAGHWGKVISGCEPVFFYTPGFRYFLFVSKFLFGDTFLGQGLMFLSLTAVMVRLLALFIRPVYAYLAVALSFCAPLAPALAAAFGWDMRFMRGLLRMDYGDPLGIALLLGGLIVLVRQMQRVGTMSFWGGTCAGLLFAMAAWVRPNLLPALAAGGLTTAALFFWTNSGRRLTVGLALGISMVFLMTAHNYAFGHKFILFKSGAMASDLLLVTPQDYFRYATSYIGGTVDHELGLRLRSSVISWLGSGTAWRILLLSGPVLVSLSPRSIPGLKVVAAMALAQHLFCLCYDPTQRYALPAWLLTSVINFVLAGHAFDLAVRSWKRRSHVQAQLIMSAKN